MVNSFLETNEVERAESVIHDTSQADSSNDRNLLLEARDWGKIY